MLFRQFYLGCLAHASYLIGSDGEAAIVDPQRDVDQYIEAAEAAGLTIRFVIETHLHADFVSGHRELAARTGAEIVFGARANAEFPHRAVNDGDELRLGSVILRILETPGHTPESISILVIDPETGPVKVLTGDTLFVGDVGRLDLAGAKGFTPQSMAEMMYDSLHGKLMVLDDAVEVFPAHGAGSACGRNISKETSSTIGDQRRRNWALQPMAREEFVKLMTTDLPEAPRYFGMDAEINRRGAGMLSELTSAPLSPAEVNKRMQQGSLVLDVRDPLAFQAGHIPGSIYLGLQGDFASWAGSLIPATAKVIVVAEGDDQVREAVLRLARVGLDLVEGHLESGLLAWEQAGLPLETIPQTTVSDLHADLGSREPILVADVRRPAEHMSGHIPGAMSLPLSKIEENLAGLDLRMPVALICASGYRSLIAASLMQRHGFRDLRNVVGGTGAWVRAGFETETTVATTGG